jgi:hypothetical protein
MVKAFIAESHRLRPRPSRRPAAADEKVAQDTRATPEEVSDATTEQPSYIDMERQASHANEAAPEDTGDLTTVDVCACSTDCSECVALLLEAFH